MSDRRPGIAVLIETSPKRVFACALAWPGWCRSGRDEPAALDALRAYAERYAPVIRRAGLDGDGEAELLGRSARAGVPSDAIGGLEVTERAEGSSGTAFGVPSAIAATDRRPVGDAEAARLAAIVAAAWATFDDVAAGAPAELRKGPRGGGRDTGRIVDHVTGADQAYAREIGVRVGTPDAGDRAAIAAMRAAMLDLLRAPSDGGPLAGRKWTSRYAARRIAWHALDHAWEIEDRSEPA